MPKTNYNQTKPLIAILKSTLARGQLQNAQCMCIHLATPNWFYVSQTNQSQSSTLVAGKKKYNFSFEKTPSDIYRSIKLMRSYHLTSMPTTQRCSHKYKITNYTNVSPC